MIVNFDRLYFKTGRLQQVQPARCHDRACGAFQGFSWHFVSMLLIECLTSS